MAKRMKLIYTHTHIYSHIHIHIYHSFTHIYIYTYIHTHIYTAFRLRNVRVLYMDLCVKVSCMNMCIYTYTHIHSIPTAKRKSRVYGSVH